MKRWISKPSRKYAGKFAVVDTALRLDPVIADGVSQAMALRMVRELEQVFA